MTSKEYPQIEMYNILKILLLLSITNDALSLCYTNHCHHLCPSGMFECVSHDHNDNHGCHCFPADYCDYTRYPCPPLHCPHNEPARCNRNNTCECYCSQDSHCQNCPEQGFCINEQCVCESNNYCPGGNQYYCLKNFHCQHDESKRCNWNDRCECFCNQDSECKNCPEKGFCVDGQCVCESHDYCAKGNHLYCMYLDATCSLGFTPKCNRSNHCYCAYVPDTCSGHDVSKCYHLKCRPGEKKFCEGRTCTCKPLDYCKKGVADCGHMACDRTLGEVSVCGTHNYCQCLAIPDLCGGSDTSTCSHLKCNQYQMKICDNGMCKCQLNPSYDSNLGLNHTCTSENTVLEMKINGTKRYKNCTDDNLFPICVDGRCQCIFWNTPSPLPSSTTVSSTDMSAKCNTRHDCNQDNTFRIFHNLRMPCPPDNMECFRGKCFCSKERVTTMAVSTTEGTTSSSTQSSQKSVTQTSPTTLPTTTAAAACNSRDDCDQGNTFMIFPGWQMPCPVDHIDCYQNKCYCSVDRVTTTEMATTPNTTTSLSTFKTSVPTTKTSIPTTKISISTADTTTTKVTTTEMVTGITHRIPATTASPAILTTTQPVAVGIQCPTCDENLNCVWKQTCYPEEVCMIRNYPGANFTTHCSRKEDCLFIKNLGAGEIWCCRDRDCIRSYLGI